MSGACTQAPLILKFDSFPKIFSDMKILRLRYNEYSRYDFFHNGLQSMFRINFLVYSGRSYIPLLFVVLSGITFIAKTGFSFLAPNSNFDRNFTKLRKYFRTWFKFWNEWWSSTCTRDLSSTCKKPFVIISSNSFRVRASLSWVF